MTYKDHPGAQAGGEASRVEVAEPTDPQPVLAEAAPEVEVALRAERDRTHAAADKALENLSEVEMACLEAMVEDFMRGIVLIDDNADKGAYQAALQEDKTDCQTLEAIVARLLANEAALLKKAVELSKLTGDQGGRGTLLVGLYENGELAIRQRSQEIVNARWTKAWDDEDDDKGELQLLYHPDAMAAQEEERGRWAHAGEICRAVKAAGYHVPADAPHGKPIGLVAASEAVTGTGTHYVASPDGVGSREAVLACFDKVSDRTIATFVCNNPGHGSDTFIGYDYVNTRDPNRGAILWLRG